MSEACRCALQNDLFRAGSQVPLTLPRSDARQNLVDALTCATSYFQPPHVHLQVDGRAHVSVTSHISNIILFFVFKYTLFGYIFHLYFI